MALLGAAGLLTCASPMKATGALQPADAPVSDAEIDAFVTLLSGSPLEPELSALSASTWRQWSDRVKRGSPGRDAEIDQLFDGFARCTAPALRRAAADMVRRKVRERGRQWMTSMTRFIQRHHARMQELAARLDGSPTLTPQETRELRRLRQIYSMGLLEPLEGGMTSAEKQALETAIEPCLTPHVAEMERRGLIEDHRGSVAP